MLFPAMNASQEVYQMQQFYSFQQQSLKTFDLLWSLLFERHRMPNASSQNKR